MKLRRLRSRGPAERASELLPIAPAAPPRRRDPAADGGMKMEQKYWYAFTPAGTLCYETGAATREGAIKNLLVAAAHMPYKTWANFRKRGYTVEQVGMKP